MSGLLLLLVLVLALGAAGGAVLGAAGLRPTRLLDTATSPPAPDPPSARSLALATVRWTWRLLPWAALSLVAGLVLLHVLLLALDAAGLPWRRRTIFGGLLVIAAAAAAAAAGARRLAWRRRRGSSSRPAAVLARGGRRSGAAPAAGLPSAGLPSAGGPSSRGGAAWVPNAWPGLGWGDALALAAVAAYAGAAWTLRINTPDFVFHWGVKGRRFALAEGIDWAYLTDPLRLANNPEYPHLLPNLYAATAHVAGGWVERPMLLGSVLLLALVWIFARQAAAVSLGRLPAQAATAAVVAASAMFGIGYDMAGGADWLVLLALTMAAAPLLRPASGAVHTVRADDLQLGLAAALAAGGKAEGVPLAALLLAVQGVRLLARLWGRRERGREPGRGGGRRLAAFALAAAVPPALVVVPWLAAALRLDLFALHKKTGGLDLDRLPVVTEALFETWGTVEWHGMPWLLVLLPVVLAARRTRALGAVLVLQLAVYLWVYLTAPLDTRFYVLSSFPRLAFHLLPVLLLALVAATAPPSRPPADLKGHES